MTLFGAASAFLTFGGLLTALIVGWIWNLVVGSPLIKGHEILGGGIDLGSFVVLPIIWIGYVVSTAPIRLKREEAVLIQSKWDTGLWETWKSDHLYSLLMIGFILSLWGYFTLLIGFFAIVSMFMPESYIQN